jgi:triosephosphate isomerase (TIM)
MIFVNFKTYEKGTGRGASDLVKILESAASTSQVKIIPVVQAADIREVVSFSKLEIWTQKIDAVTFGAHTGAILPEAVVEDGAQGVFINHSEAKLGSLEEIKSVMQRAKSVDLKTLIFAKDMVELTAIAQLSPTYVSYEPPQLIGSTTTSVAQAEPDIIAKAVEVAKSFGLPLIVGAGVHSREDVKKSLELGAVGVAVAKDIMMAEDPEKEVLDLAEGFK